MIHDPIDPHGAEDRHGVVLEFRRRRGQPAAGPFTCEQCGREGLVGVVGVVDHAARCPSA